MKLLSLDINNFRSYEKGVIEFSSEQNYIFGKNWQGKTSVMDAIGFALFGKRAFPTRLAGSVVRVQHLVHEGKAKGSVALGFEHNGKTYLLSRECPREISTLTSEGKRLVPLRPSLGRPFTNFWELMRTFSRMSSTRSRMS